MKRIQSIDFTRGLVMVIMALDHVRDMLHTTSLVQQPTNLQTTTAGLFMTRWITYLCAPTFVFLSGVSAWVSFTKTGNVKVNRRFLLTRGLWLILLEFTVVNFALWFDIRFRVLILEVIAAIGFGFVVLSLLLGLPSRVVGMIGLTIIFGHNLLQAVSISAGAPLNFFFSLLFRPNMVVVGPEFNFLVGYPLVPWLGIMLAGFGCGPFFTLPQEKRKRIFFRLGIIVLLFFVFLRMSNAYGDPFVWSTQKNKLFSFLSFINVTKYPPSLLFDSLMLGMMFLILSFAEKVSNRFMSIFIVYGQVPLFFFILHLFLAHLISLGIILGQGFGPSDMRFDFMQFGRPAKTSGLRLPGIYLVWLLIVMVFYPVCKWYGSYKTSHPNKIWLRYL